MSRVKPKGRISRPERDPRAAIESFDTIEAVTPEMHEQIARDYPDLLAKLPPKKPPAPSVRRGRAVTKVVEDINEVNIRARAAAEHGCDLVRCMGCGRLAELPISRRGRRLRCTRCGAVGLNISVIEPDPGQPAQRTRRTAAR